MKKGKSIVELATEIERQANSRQDMLADTRILSLSPSVKHGMELVVGDAGSYQIKPTAHRQIGTKLAIPATYYDRMLSQAPDLLATNANYWLHAVPEKRLVRTLDGSARAFLSDRYRRIDNDVIASAVLPVLMEANDIEIMSSEITDKKLYIQAVFPKVEGEVKVGEVVQSGFVVTNSEIGLGGFSIYDLVYTLRCTNGMIGSHSMRKYHVGRRAEIEDGSFEIFSDETLAADDKALMLKMRDVVRAAMNQEMFDKQLEALRESTKTEKMHNPVASVEVLAKRMQLNESESSSVLRNIIEYGDLTKYGMLNAVTSVANEHDSYDRAIELEAMGGKVLTLNRKDWKEIAEAA